MRPIGLSESDKDELSLEINPFDKPKTQNSINAWSQLILNLLFLRPGTYPSLPEMGIDIQNYEYDFLDEGLDRLSSIITEQCQKYLPDVPLTSVEVSSYDFKGTPILLVKLAFMTQSEGEITSAIAIDPSTKNNERFLNFDVSW